MDERGLVVMSVQTSARVKVEGWITPIYHLRANPVERHNQDFKKGLGTQLVDTNINLGTQNYPRYCTGVTNRHATNPRSSCPWQGGKDIQGLGAVKISISLLRKITGREGSAEKAAYKGKRYWSNRAKHQVRQRRCGLLQSIPTPPI